MPKNSSKPCKVGRILILVAQVVLTKLPCRVAVRLKQLGDGGIFRFQSHVRTGHSDFGQAGTIGFWPVMKAARPAVQLCWP